MGSLDSNIEFWRLVQGIDPPPYKPPCKETRMSGNEIESITFGCGCRATPRDKDGTSWSLKHNHVVDPIPTPSLPLQQYRFVTAADLDKLQALLRAREDELLKVKGHDYTRGGPDRLANFIEDGKVLGISPERAWAVHFRKQIAAVMTWAATGQLESESLASRFVDIRNYCLLGLALHEANPKQNPGKDTECAPLRT